MDSDVSGILILEFVSMSLSTQAGQRFKKYSSSNSMGPWTYALGNLTKKAQAIEWAFGTLSEEHVF